MTLSDLIYCKLICSTAASLSKSAAYVAVKLYKNNWELCCPCILFCYILFWREVAPNLWTNAVIVAAVQTQNYDEWLILLYVLSNSWIFDYLEWSWGLVILTYIFFLDFCNRKPKWALNPLLFSSRAHYKSKCQTCFGKTTNDSSRRSPVVRGCVW